MLSGSCSITIRAAMAAAGAVLRPTGSSTIAWGEIPAWRICSAIRKRCSMLQTISGAAKSASATRSPVSWIRLFSPAKTSNCLGKRLRDSGQSRDPAPPERMTGVIEDMGRRARIRGGLLSRIGLEGEEFPKTDNLTEIQIVAPQQHHNLLSLWV